ncbi:hypothetical protein AB0368_12285 [Actinoplanes sp. NPDC051475]|uniref:hypothetical protein n=1 Tax=Actinoplanes sp. NPDC051475 TaxID=3157225 RepID=UPI00344B9C32
MDHKVWMYLAYLIISVGLTIWVATTLSRNGLVFLEDVFADSRLAKAVNHLLVMGFYLLNLGYVAVAMRSGARIPDAARALETLSFKIGFVLLVLGGLHVLNVVVLGRYRRGRLRQQQAMPPLPPAGRLPMYPPGPGPQGPFGGAGTAPGGPVPTGPIPGGPAQGGPAHGGPAHGGPAHGGPAHGGPVQKGPAQGGAGKAQAGGSDGTLTWPGQGMAGPVPPPARA